MTLSARTVPDMLGTSAEFAMFTCVLNIAAYLCFALHMFIVWIVAQTRVETQDYSQSELIRLLFIRTLDRSTHFSLPIVVLLEERKSEGSHFLMLAPYLFSLVIKIAQCGIRAR